MTIRQTLVAALAAIVTFLVLVALFGCTETHTLVRGPCVRITQEGNPAWRCSGKQFIRLEVRFR